MNSSNSVKLLERAFVSQTRAMPRIAKQLELSFRKAPSKSGFERSELATMFIVRWLYEYTAFQHSINEQFNRRVTHPAADEFTAAVAFTLEQFLCARGFRGWVHSEIQVPGVKKLQCDIVVKSPDNIPVAVIECKTQFGRSRYEWENQQSGRENTIRKVHRKLIVALCVHRRANWNVTWAAFDKGIAKGKHWVCLMQNDPKTIAECNQLHGRIEPLFSLIAARCKEYSK